MRTKATDRMGLVLMVMGLCVATPTVGQQTGTFFRIVSQTNTVITEFSRAGTLVWSNAATVGVTCLVQRSSTLTGPSNWCDYARNAATSTVMALRIYDPNTPAGMVFIPGGVNSGTNPLGPGDPAYDPFWYPSNYVLTVSAFYMDKYEVTKALWDEVATWALSHGYVFDRTSQFPGVDRGTNYPVQTVTWYDCVKWCNARSEKENRPVCYWDGAAVYRTGQQFRVSCATNAPGYRLPTDMEWEYAARGGVSSKRFPWGSDTISYDFANYYAVKWSNYDLSTGGYHPSYNYAPTPPHTSPVGAFELGKNGYGLYDMAGNVSEWCWEWDIQGQTFRILRGGSADQGPTWSRIGRRSNNGPDYGFYNVGFRTVMARPQ